jgi:hypothetical protein
LDEPSLATHFGPKYIWLVLEQALVGNTHGIQYKNHSSHLEAHLGTGSSSQEVSLMIGLPIVVGRLDQRPLFLQQPQHQHLKMEWCHLVAQTQEGECRADYLRMRACKIIRNDQAHS